MIMSFRVHDAPTTDAVAGPSLPVCPQFATASISRCGPALRWIALRTKLPFLRERAATYPAALFVAPHGDHLIQ